MNKIILIILFICFIVISCGKKGDPVYKESRNNFERIKLKVIL